MAYNLLRSFYMPGPNPLLNHNFFNPNNQTQHSAYILGFLTSDGSVRSNKDAISFAISSKDIEVLKYLRLCISSSDTFPSIGISAPKYYPEKMVKNNGELCRITFCSRTMVNDLYKFGVEPRKTGHEKYPTLLRDDLKYHYLRGLIDGDGCISITKRTRNQKITYEPKLLIFSANLLFLEELRLNMGLMKDFRIIKNQTCNTIYTQKLSNILNLRSAMYDDAIFSLQRKKDRFFSIPEDKAYRIFSEYKTAKEWSCDERCKIDYKTFLYRIKHGWDYEQALSHPSDKGSGCRGEEAHSAMLSDQQAQDIRIRKSNGESAIKLAREYNISTNAIHYCVKKRKIHNKERKCS